MYKNISFILLLLSAFSLQAYAQVNVGEEAPEFELIVLDSQGQDTVVLSQLEGKVVYIFFYGAGCPHCISNGPVTETEIYQPLKEDTNFVALGLDTWNQNESSNRSFRNSTGITYTLLLNAQTTLVNYYGGSGFYDRSVVIDAEGNVAYKGTGFVNTDFEQVVDVIEQELSTITTSSELAEENPTQVSLFQNYPNPFNPSTNISFELDISSEVTLSIYNVLGEKVSNLINGFLPSGAHSVTWDASAFPSGIYLYRLETAQGSFSRKMLLVK
ncbi:MAG: redoxin family protein [Balneolales bacterium]|nr:redoxin family protein [Balneolales bacterium]